MPPTKEMIEKARECFGEMKLVKFTADRTQIRPGDGGVNLSWEVTIPSNCRVALAIQLNGANVSRKASKKVNPVQSISYRLLARAAGMVKTLGVIQIQVDTSSCTQTEIAESIIAPQIQQSVVSSITEYNNDPESAVKVSQRREAQIQIEPIGIIVKLRMVIEINNFFDPDLDIDAKIAVGISAEGNPLAYYRSFSVDVDWPWWVTGLTLGITKIVEEVVEDLVEKELKNTILTRLKSNLESAIALAGGTVSSIETSQDRISITTC